MAKSKRHATHVTLPSGERVFVSAKTQKELDIKVNNIKAQVGAGIKVADKTTVRGLAEMWLEVYKKPKVKPQTYITIETQVRLHIVKYFGDMLVKDVMPIHVQGFINSLSDLKHDTQAKVIRRAKAIFRVAVDNYLILRSPFTTEDKALGEAPDEKEALTDDETRSLLDAAKKYKPEAYTFVLLALNTGMRRGELLALRWDCVDFATNTIRVERNYVSRDGEHLYSEPLKTKTSERTLPMPEGLAEHLKSVKSMSHSMFVVADSSGRPLRDTSLCNVFKVLNRRTGLQATSHLLRHTYCTILIESDINVKAVQRLMGHATPDITLRVYSHYRERVKKEDTATQVGNALRNIS